ncbi:ATP-binding cassette subfamily B protein [Silvibacterium bohemicum]|uniref:ATP-binding cassette subfamily B protein n=1 Tax=Silvibacterium bohemicum TaxID=1577686 RepID=A0A841K1S2_9BACT|nr:ABC transporter ATP-binding protein [Silvibacterium bohemicum]MBB6145121.1 ATP-binding cassette subfamily B protein [Silvibacterium bohemicum]
MATKTASRRDQKSATPVIDIHLRSAIPGRERWEVEEIRHKPRIAAVVQSALQEKQGILTVVANPMTGRILVTYEPDSPQGQIEALLRAALQKSSKARASEGSQELSLFQNPLLRLVLRVEPDRKLLNKAAAASVLSTLGNFVIAWCTSALLGVVAKRGKTKSAKSDLWFFGFVTAAGATAAVVVRHYQNRYWKALATSVEHELRTRAFAHLEELDMSYFDNESTGALMNVLSADLANVSKFIETGPGIAIESATSVGVAIGLLLLVAPGIAVIVTLPIAAVFLTYRYFQRQLAPRYANVGLRSAELNGVLTNNLSGVATVKSFTAESYEAKRVRDLSNQVRQANVDAAVAGSAYASMQGGIYGSVAAFALALGGVSVEEGSLTSGAFLTLAQLIPRLMSAMGAINDLYDLYMNASASSARVLELLDTQPAIRNGKRRLALDRVRGEISFSSVGFAYRQGYDVLKGLDLQLGAGETIGVVGATGAGKTTLVKLLLRFYDVNRGAVTIDGINVRDLTLQDLRQAVGFVSQDVYLFDGTVSDNIVYGRPEATREEVIKAARAAEAEEFIRGLPQGYDTPVGERGSRLSAGQRQRISIARAILKDAPILVLDEATASVDNETEAAIHRSIERLEAGRSMMIIAHRLSTVRNAHRIYVMEDGRILEQGKHDELLALNGLYASLWDVQTGMVRGQTDPLSRG